MVCTQDLLHYT